MFNGYRLKSCRERSTIYVNINDPKFQIFVFTTLFNNSKPVYYSVVKNYHFYTHNLSGPARICYQLINNKHRIFSEQYYIIDHEMSKEEWKKIVSVMRSDKKKSIQKLEKELYKNYDKCMAYLFDQNSLDPFDFPSFNFEQISEYLKNEKIKDTINSMLILNKLSN